MSKKAGNQKEQILRILISTMLVISLLFPVSTVFSLADSIPQNSSCSGGLSLLDVQALEAEASAVETWTNENAVEVYVEEPYIDEIRLDPEAAFAELSPAAVLIKDFRSYGMKLLLVLPESGKEAQTAAIEALQDDPRVSSARPCSDVPFETVNTLHLSCSEQAVYVGDTFSIRPGGEVRVYTTRYSGNALDIVIDNYNPNKDYTVDDFPQVPLKDISQWGNPGYFHLKLEEEKPGYFGLIQAVNLLARSPHITAACVHPPVGAIRPSEFCVLSDPSVAQFMNTANEEYADGALVGKADENGDYVLKALAPGKTTVTYYNYGEHGGPYTAQLDITINPQNPEASSNVSSDDKELNDSNHSQASISSMGQGNSNNPKTGDAFPIFGFILCTVTSLYCLSVTLHRRKG